MEEDIKRNKGMFKENYGNDSIEEMQEIIFLKLEGSYDFFNNGPKYHKVSQMFSDNRFFKEAYNTSPHFILLLLAQTFYEVNMTAMRLKSKGKLTADSAKMYFDSIDEAQKELCKNEYFKKHFEDGKAFEGAMVAIQTTPRKIRSLIKAMVAYSKGEYKHILEFQKSEKSGGELSEMFRGMFVGDIKG